MFVMLLNMDALEHYSHDDIHITEYDMDCSAFFVSGHEDARDIITTKLNGLGIGIDPRYIIFDQSIVLDVCIIRLYVECTMTPVIVGTLRKATDALLITENFDKFESGFLYPYRVVFSLPEDIRPRLLTYVPDLSSAVRCVNDVVNNEFGVKVYFEENLYYDENMTIETALSLLDSLEEE